MQNTEPQMTIGKLASEAGVTTHALRHYEQEGILVPTVRSKSGYRLYCAEAAERLLFIRSAQAVGFTLKDIRALLTLDRGNATDCRSEVRRLLNQRLAQVNEKMAGLRRVRKALAHALDRCGNSKGDCTVLKDLRSKRKASKS